MGRNMFGPVPRPLGASQPWDGWWGDDPPYHAPVFVLTHHEREPLRDAGRHDLPLRHRRHRGRARAAPRTRRASKDVALGGGASVVAAVRSTAGLLDELTLNVVPILLGGGARLLDGLGDADIALECTRVVHGAGRDAPHVSRRATQR